MPDTSIRARLVLTLLLIIGGGALVQVASYVLERSDTVAMQERGGRLRELRDLGHELREAIGGQHDALLLYLLTADLSQVQAYNAARLEEAVLLGSSDAVISGDVGVIAALDGISQATDNWRVSFADPSIELMQSDRIEAARSEGRMRRGEALYRGILTADLALHTRAGELSSASLADLDRIQQSQLVLFLASLVGALIGLAVAIGLLARWILHPLGALLTTARRVEAGEDVIFQADREDEVGRLGQALEHMRVGLLGQATEASVINRFTELTAFVEADGDVARATLDALGELAAPDQGTIHISNRSKDRAIPEGSIGDVSPEIISLGQLAHCPGVRRSSLYVMPDLAGSMSVRCPVYPAVGGTLACLPLIALGEVVGAVHLHWNETDSLPLEIRSTVTRITEHASLAIANRRLMTALQGMANTDGRTGLPNSRAFDEALEEKMTSRGDGEPLSVLMLDLDHFKLFNDRNGHPAGDRALRAFAGILRGAVRDGDMAARYGGEEFVVMLPGSSAANAAEVAERIRALTEETVIDLSPGHRDQITVSIGVAAWPTDATDRVRLLEVADAALYRAKNAGRNRVGVAGQAFEARADEGVQGPAASDADDLAEAHDRAASAPAGPVALHLAG